LGWRGRRWWRGAGESGEVKRVGALVLCGRGWGRKSGVMGVRRRTVERGPGSGRVEG